MLLVQRGLYMEGLIFGILWLFTSRKNSKNGYIIKYFILLFTL